MEESYHQNHALSWAAAASRDERMRLLKRFLDILPEDELAQVSNLASKAKKRRKRKSKQVVPAPEKSVSVPTVPPSSPTHARPKSAGLGWFRKFKRSDVVAMDVEKVDVYIKNPMSRKRFIQKAAKVTVVNINEDVIFQATIWHQNKSYRVSSHSFKINGIAQDSLESLSNPKPLEVSSQLQEIFDGKLVVGIKLLGDFESLDLAIGDCDTFDLNWHWWRNSMNRDGVLVKEDLGLRSLCKHYFQFDMQMDTLPHSDLVDAVWTMRLFRDVYVKIQPEPITKHNEDPSNEIEHYANLYKRV